MISRIVLTTLCFQDMGHSLCWNIFFRCCYCGSFAKFFAGFAQNGYLNDMCYAKISQNHNCPFANIIAELLRTPKCTCNVRFFYKSPPGPLDRCSHTFLTRFPDFSWASRLKPSKRSSQSPQPTPVTSCGSDGGCQTGLLLRNLCYLVYLHIS